MQIRGPHLDENFAYAEKLLHRLRHIPGLVDARIQQSLNAPAFDVNVDRTRAQYVGITERDVTNSMVVNLAGSGQVQPTYWLNPANGVSYSIVLQTPEYQVEFDQRAAKSADHRARRAAANARSRLPTSSGWRHQPSIHNTTFSPWSSFTPPPRIAISARLRPMCRRS